MARDEELRKVAEDVKALARSLAKDFRDSVDQSRRGGDRTGRAVRDGVRNVVDQVGRDLRSGLGHGPRGSYRRHGYYRGYGWWGHSPWAPPPSPPPPGATGPSTGDPAGGGPQSAGPQLAGTWMGPARYRPRPERPRRGKLPPVRRRWDASTVLGMIAVLFGVSWLLGVATGLKLPIEAVVAVGLMLLGASIIITGRTDWSLSRRSWPVWLGLGFIAILMATSSTFGVGSALSDVTFGTQSPTAENGKTIHGGFGDLNVNATGLTPGQSVKIENAAGRMIITPPSGLPLVVHARVAAGQICADGNSLGNGVGPDVHWTSQPGPIDPSKVITIDAHELFGQIIIGSPGCN